MRELGLNWPFWWEWRYQYWGFAHRQRARVELDEIVRDGGPVEAVAKLPGKAELFDLLERMRREHDEEQVALELSVSHELIQVEHQREIGGTSLKVEA